MFYYLQGVEARNSDVVHNICNDTDLARLGRAAAEYDITGRGYSHLQIVCRETGATASTWHPRRQGAEPDVPNLHEEAPTVQDVQDMLSLARSDLYGAVGALLKLKQMTLEELPDEIADIAQQVQHTLDNLDWFRMKITENNGITYSDS